MTEGSPTRFLVTGGSGFIGSAVVRNLVSAGHVVHNIDAMTYAASREATASVSEDDRYTHLEFDITDRSAVETAFVTADPDIVMHLAAESHVDRSIDHPAEFVRTNVIGTTNLLEAASNHYAGIDSDRRDRFRFHHVSTDEVFGALGTEGIFDASTPYDPRSPYSASKAAADHFVRAWNHTYGLPIVLSNCSNNYGAFQQPEKLIPKTIIHALRSMEIPVYGRGEQVRDWLYVEDHVDALVAIAQRGKVGETYLVGGSAERRNIDVVTQVCAIVDDLTNRDSPTRDLISFVTDRPGHDFRYAIDHQGTTDALGWQPTTTFDDGLRSTVQWYIEHEDWWSPLVDESGATVRQGIAT